MPAGPLVYPEYLNDLKLLVCPSDSDGQNRYDGGRWNVDGKPALPVNPCRIDTLSYFYVGWLIDMKQHVALPGVDINAAAMPVDASAVGTYIDPFTLDIFSNIFSSGKSIPERIAAAVAAGMGAGATPERIVEDYVRPVIDRDIPFKDYSAAPSSDSRVLMRLKDGIERFLITDINNPAGSAQAQSAIQVMSDEVNTDSQHFSHVPGGANVLYMDGHVSWIKYPGDGFVSKLWAVILGL
ncbi:MAG: hypothetical protein HZB26_07020 [Candidatus Hydrogenedentes bacterium]|nr:hypothetical protein [Candidatus Hydrogenedentota bacterium]